MLTTEAEAKPAMTLPDSRPAVAPTGAGRYPMRGGGVAVITDKRGNLWPWRGHTQDKPFSGLGASWTLGGSFYEEDDLDGFDIIGPMLEDSPS